MFELFIKNFLTTIEWQFIIKTVLCLVIGFFIGKERQLKGKNAWVSTFSLVITGSMLFTYLWIISGDHDSGRIAAGIVTWIWFLGAWLIIKNDLKVVNLTTAAGIRFSGAIGMTIGMWYYTIAIIAAAVATMVSWWSDTFVKEWKISQIKQKASATIRTRKNTKINEE